MSRDKNKGKPAKQPEVSILSRTITISAPRDLNDAEIERLIEAIEDEVSMGLEAVGRSVAEKFGSGRLTFKVEE